MSSSLLALSPSSFAPGSLWASLLTWLHDDRRPLLAALGFMPIASLSLALMNVLPLHHAMRWLVLPAVLGLAFTCARAPRLRRLATHGLLAGMVATAVYDLSRLTLVLAGVWGDFIPVIGRMALCDASAHWAWGYLWRFFLNGGLMGVACAMLPIRGGRMGAAFGVAICLGLFATLRLCPSAQQVMFTLTPTTCAAALIGHLEFGAVLGRLLAVWDRGSASMAVTPALGGL